MPEEKFYIDKSRSKVKTKSFENQFLAKLFSQVLAIDVSNFSLDNQEYQNLQQLQSIRVEHFGGQVQVVSKLTFYNKFRGKVFEKAPDGFEKKAQAFIKEYSQDRSTELPDFNDQENQYIIRLIEGSIESSVDAIIDQIRKGTNPIRFTTGSSVAGHAYLLYLDPMNRYKIISSTQYESETISVMKSSYWFKYLRQTLSPETDIDFVTKNQQNYSIGCVFCDFWTEHLLRKGKSLSDIPDKMDFELETSMMQNAYKFLRPLYKDQELTEPNEMGIGFIIHENLSSSQFSEDIESFKADIKRSIDGNVNTQRSFATASRPQRRDEYIYDKVKGHDNLYKSQNDPDYEYAIRDKRKLGVGDDKAEITQTHKIIVEAITRNLAKAITRTEALYDGYIFNDAMLKTILNFACLNKGVGNVGEAVWDRQLPDNIGQFAFAKNLSFQYQKICQENSIFTGRVENCKELHVGMRLKRIPPEIHDEVIAGAIGMVDNPLSM
jgi:hypothetical protein